MSEPEGTLIGVLAHRYAANLARVRELAAPLSNTQFWSKPFAFGNSFGHLVLHLTGNLNYYIGAQIANTGYLRDRAREFNDPESALQRGSFEAAGWSGCDGHRDNPQTIVRRLGVSPIRL